jgi:hypothetical protein
MEERGELGLVIGKALFPASATNIDVTTVGTHMNAPVKLQDFTQSHNESSPLRRLLRAFVTLFSSPKGDQGGWEAGARGL